MSLHERVCKRAISAFVQMSPTPFTHLAPAVIDRIHAVRYANYLLNPTFFLWQCGHLNPPPGSWYSWTTSPSFSMWYSGMCFFSNLRYAILQSWNIFSLSFQGICGVVTGHWVVDFNEATCVTWWNGITTRYSLIYIYIVQLFQPQMINLGLRRTRSSCSFSYYQSFFGIPLTTMFCSVTNLAWWMQSGDDWQEVCATTPGHVQGKDFDGPTSCATWVRWHVYISSLFFSYDLFWSLFISGPSVHGIWLIEDADCLYENHWIGNKTTARHFSSTPWLRWVAK